MAATVGTLDISLAELNSAYDRLPAEYKQQLSKTDVLKQLIDEKLLILDAEAKKITVPDKEVQTEIAGLMKANNISETEFVQAIRLPMAASAQEYRPVSPDVFQQSVLQALWLLLLLFSRIQRKGEPARFAGRPQMLAKVPG